MRTIPATSPSRAASAADASARTLLLECLHTTARPRALAAAAARMDETGWHRFGAIATDQHVRPLVREALMKHGNLGVPASISDVLDRQCRRIATRMLARYAELARIIQDLTAADIPVIVLKGGCLATLVYRDIGLREMIDLDLLVPRERLQATVDVLLARGYQPLRRFSVAVDQRVTHHVAPLVKGMMRVEIHWNVTLPGQTYTIDPAELWSRAVPMSVGGVPALRLSLEDLLLHLCMHASYHHQFEFGLRPSCDIAALIGQHHDRLDWDAVCERSARWRWSKGVYVALSLARRLIGADVPPEVLSRLQGIDSVDAVTMANRLLWTTPAELDAFSPMVAALGPHASWSHRLRHGLAPVVPSRVRLAWIYAIQPTTAWLPLYYVRRAWDLLWRHGPSAVRLVAGRDADVRALAAHRDRMREWLRDS